MLSDGTACLPNAQSWLPAPAQSCLIACWQHPVRSAPGFATAAAAAGCDEQRQVPLGGARRQLLWRLLLPPTRAGSDQAPTYCRLRGSNWCWSPGTACHNAPHGSPPPLHIGEGNISDGQEATCLLPNILTWVMAAHDHTRSHLTTHVHMHVFALCLSASLHENGRLLLATPSARVLCMHRARVNHLQTSA